LFSDDPYEEESSSTSAPSQPPPLWPETLNRATQKPNHSGGRRQKDVKTSGKKSWQWPNLKHLSFIEMDFANIKLKLNISVKTI
jgi:hypothetical protein